MLHAAVELGYRVQEQQLVQRDAGGLYVRILPNGKPAAILQHPVHGTTIRFIPERTYGKSGTLSSISYEQRPDIAIEVERPGLPVEIDLFDPKYKLDSETLDPEHSYGQPQKIDIDKMHAYRDAIRDGQGVRVVRSAATLYPGQTISYGDGIAALRAVPGEEGVLERELQHLFQQTLAELTIQTLIQPT